ncbi:amidase [Tsukamurella spumae]|uniref:amidase n=1 Tax=Tsukamurella spumae TaxID=44753 RepID=A0A846WYN0_9ACTN|nr:amidase [Tsukamurella spumae]NKY17122.1 amidase [Tsukamurella spumae]
MTLISAAATAERVRTGQLTAVAATREALARIGDDEVNGWRVLRPEEALAEAAAIDARADRYSLPLAGVPIAIKDNIAVSGYRTLDGVSEACGAGLPIESADHPVVKRLRAAGAVVVGLTRAPELCLWAMTDDARAVVGNPHRPGRTPGGSSGGSAAVVAAGHVALAHGNDGLGSLRGPAACTGTVAIKPGRGVVPAQLGPSNWFGMAENGPMTRTVEDAALGLSVLADRPELAVVGDGAGLRVGLGLNRPSPATFTSRAIRATVRDAAGRLSARGHSVHEVRVPYPVSPMALLTRWVAAAAVDAEDIVARGADPLLLQARTRRHAAIGRAVNRRGLVRPAEVARIESSLERFFADQRLDVLMTPALARKPARARHYSNLPWAASVIPSLAYATYPSLWNLVGWPAMTVPFQGEGVQLIARPGGEADLLALAAKIEQ